MIEWNHLSPQGWQERFALVSRSNMLQAFEYAKAICPLKRQKGRWGLIRIEGQEAGLVQMLEAGALGNALHALVIDRGPLWFEGFGEIRHYEAFIKTLLSQYPQRLGRKFRIIPEMEDTQALQDLMRALGFKEAAPSPYQTIWLDIDKDEEVLREGLRKNWRNMLSRAEREEGLSVTWEMNTPSYKEALQNYAYDKALKGYDGPSVELLQALTKTFLPARKMVLGRVLDKGGQMQACVLHFYHGRSATYQMGWTSETGRKTGAQNLLLWNSLEILKNHGIKELDLGGCNDENAKGVAQFKDGMGGVAVRLGRIYTA